MSPNGAVTPEQSSGSQSVIEPQNLEYGNQPDMAPVEQYPVQQEVYQPVQEAPIQEAPVYEQQYVETPPEIQQETYEQPVEAVPAYQEMYPQDPIHPITYEAAPEDFGTETYSIPEGIEQPQPVQQAPEQRPDLYPAHSQEVIKTSETPALQERLVRQSREGEKVFINPNLDPRSGQQTQVVVTQQQVVSAISGYPVSNALSTNPLAALLQQTVTSGDPHAGTTWQATIISKIAMVLSRLLPR